MLMRLIYLVLDGAADRIIDSPTAYEVADKPNLDSIARMGKAGLVYTIGRGIAPESDAAVLSILGYDPHKYYTGRGPLEALGVGITIREGYEVAFRANFATVLGDGVTLVDRRVGRNLSTVEATILAEAVDGLDLGVFEGYSMVKATVGHRAVVVIGSRRFKLSDNVSNTDPAYIKRGRISVAVHDFKPEVVECTPLDGSSEAYRTARLVNVFTRKSFEILDKHPVNIERTRKGLLKANIVLLRDSGGRLPTVKPIREVYGMPLAAVAEMPVEKGIARLLKMRVMEVPPPTSDKRSDYQIRLEAALKALREDGSVYVHLKGPDEPAHDGDFERKVKAIEDIDKYFIGPLLDNISIENTAIIVTSDHATPPKVKSHTDDPVPLVVAAGWIECDGIRRFSEKECAKGSLGIIEHGWQILPTIIRILKR